MGGALEGKTLRRVAAGAYLTVVSASDGRVYQMGQTGAAASKHCPWEGSTAPEQARAAHPMCSCSATGPHRGCVMLG